MARQARETPANLPHQLTSFVGRTGDLRALRDLLESSRMVTLLGTGGAGKSRLAIEVARANQNRWPDGIWWTELASASDVAGTLVAALELPGRGAPADVISAWLASRRSLVILDNCEHVVAACAELTETLLGRCPQLTILATTRAPLGVRGEARWPVAPLDAADAIRLFEARGRLVAPGFKVAGPNQKAITAICMRLDRLPLAIEMAAGHLDVMSEDELLGNLDYGLRLLRSGSRTVPERQQTMAAAIEWSHRLLTENEARLFRRLAVFRGGFTLDAAQSVGADAGGANVFELLSALVRKSMVVSEKLDDGSSRYRLLESHHAFAFDRLRESDELQAIRRRHHDYFFGRLDSPSPPKRKSSDTENLWSALEWARAEGEDHGVGFAVRLAEFEFSDQRRIRDVLLELIEGHWGSPEAKVRAHNLAARLVARQGDVKMSKSLADSSVKMARKLADRDLLAYAVRGAGLVYHTRGELDVAQAMYSEALSLLKDSDNKRLATEVKNSLGLLAVERGDYRLGLEMLNECVSQSRNTADHAGRAQYLESLANAQLALGDAAGASGSWVEPLSIFRDLDDAFGSIWCLGGLSLAAAHRKEFDRAVRLASAADRMSREWSLKTGPFRRDQLAAMVEEARSKLGSTRWQSSWEDGQAMTMPRAVEYALGSTGTDVIAATGGGPLSRREREVAGMVAAGLTNRQIAERLFISERTAEGHVERIRNKLGVRSRTEVATWAVTHGLSGTHLDKSTPASTV